MKTYHIVHDECDKFYIHTTYMYICFDEIVSGWKLKKTVESKREKFKLRWADMAIFVWHVLTSSVESINSWWVQAKTKKKNKT